MLTIRLQSILWVTGCPLTDIFSKILKLNSNIHAHCSSLVSSLVTFRQSQAMIKLKWNIHTVVERGNLCWVVTQELEEISTPDPGTWSPAASGYITHPPWIFHHHLDNWPWHLGLNPKQNIFWGYKTFHYLFLLYNISKCQHFSSKILAWTLKFTHAKGMAVGLIILVLLEIPRLFGSSSNPNNILSLFLTFCLRLSKSPWKIRTQ